MLNAKITWAGTSSDQGSFRDSLYIKKEPDFIIPKRKIQVFSVPGRNGDIIIPQDAWENITKQYVLFVKPDLSRGSLAGLCRDVASWLCSPVGYNVLQDSYEQDYFYLAYLADKTQIANHLQRFGTATINFSCRPEKFLSNGAVERSITGNTINNPTQFASKPLIRLMQNTGEGEATITINDVTVTISTMTPAGSTQGFKLDCDTQNAYTGVNTNRNNRVVLNNDVFPVLTPGENTISYTGDIRRVYITPRWWTI